MQTAHDGTRKLRFRTHDGRAIESVLIPDEDAARNKLTLCISSQVGCAIDCRFCATATLGFGRHLGAGEIVAQVYRATALAGRRPTNLVFMGMGEPLHNFDNVTRALALLEHPWGAGFSPRRITVSTAGLVPGIEKLGALKPAPNLAISLNATTDEVRDADHADQPEVAHRRAAGRRPPVPAVARPPRDLRVRAARRRQRQRRRRRPPARACCAASRQGEPDPLEPVQRARVPAAVRRAHPDVPGAPARGRGLPSTSGRRAATTSTPPAASSPRASSFTNLAPRMSAADELDEARALATDACGRIAEFWGFTRTMGRAFGLLYLSREPLPQAEIQARLGISAGSASMTLAALGRWGVVHKIWVRGQRREHYQAETDFWKMISGVLNERERREIGAAVEVVSRAEASARAAQAAVRGAAKADADFVVERVARLGEICRNGETMLDMLLGQLTLDVGRFRDVLKVAPRAPAPAGGEPGRLALHPDPLPQAGEGERVRSGPLAPRSGERVRERGRPPSRAARQSRPATPPRACRARARSRTPSAPRAAATSGSTRRARRCAGRTRCRGRRAG